MKTDENVKHKKNIEVKSVISACEAIKKDKKSNVDYYNVETVEDYSVRDATLWFNDRSSIPLEVKHCNGELLHSDGSLNGDYNSSDSGKMLSELYTWDKDNGYFINALPESMRGYCIFAINNEGSNTKWRKIMRAGAWFAIDANDCVVWFTNEQLKNAYLGDAFWNCYHTTDVEGKVSKYKKKERKAFIDISKGNIIRKV